MKLKLTVTVEYDANPEHYDTDNPVLAAMVDQTNWTNEPESLMEFLMNQDYTLRVVPA